MGGVAVLAYLRPAAAGLTSTDRLMPDSDMTYYMHYSEAETGHSTHA